MAFTIRRAEKEDLSTIRHLASLIWPVAYAEILSAGQINYMLNAMYNLPALKKQLLEGHIFLLAFKDEKPVGFSGISPLEKTGYWKLHKLYIVPYKQHTGAGKALLASVYEIMTAQNGTHLKLQVNRENEARNFYKKQGFEIISERNVDIGKGFYMNDFIMQKQIQQAVRS